jgi:Tfp pilus assembly protein PilN
MMASRSWKAGIQIGRQHVKLVVMRKKGKRWNVVLEDTETAPEAIMKDGKVLQPELAGLQIRKLWMKHRLKVRHVSVVAEEMPFYVRRLHLPRMPKKEIPKAVENKARLELPVELRDVAIRFFPVREAKKEDRETTQEYVLVAAYKSDIDALVRAVKAAGLSVQAVGLEPDAICRGLAYDKPDEPVQHTRLLVKMGANRMMLAVMSGGQFDYARYVPIRGEGRDGTEEIAGEIDRTVMGWEASAGGRTIQTIVFLDEREEWPAVRERIGRSFSGETVVLPAPYTACLGAVLPAEGRINFHSDPPPLHKLTRSPLYLKAAALVMLAAVAAGLYESGSAYMLRRDIDRLQQQLDRNREAKEWADEKLVLMELVRHLQQASDEYADRHVSSDALYDFVMDRLPPGVIIHDMAFTRDELTVSGFAPDQHAVTELLRNFQEAGLFPRVSLVHSSEGDGLYSFALRLETGNAAEQDET